MYRRRAVSKRRWINRLFQSSPSAARLRRRNAIHSATPAIESLETRILPAVNAVFAPGTGVLTVFGDGADNTLTVDRNAAGVLRVNGGAVTIRGGTPTIANTSLIQIFGQGGNDVLSLDETHGALPSANLFGGAGNDTLVGGSGGDQLFGQAGLDILLGKGGVDFLFGGSENDTLAGGDGDDLVFGESGNDTMVWNPGDDTDLNEGGSGIDTVEVNGGNGAEQFTLIANGSRVRFDRLTPAPFSLDIGTSEHFVLNANGGDDMFSAVGNLAALIQISVDGGAGNDALFGGNGADVLIGGEGNDFIDGQQGNDLALLGAGNDVFQWDPGDGSDTVEGQAGSDTLLFNGSAGNETFVVGANGQRVRFTRNVGNIVMDLDDIESLNLNTFAGSDTVMLNELSGTDLVDVNIDLAASNGADDAAADVVVVAGTSDADIIDVFGSGNDVAVVGLNTLVSVLNAEAANDSLVVNALGGNDGLTATTLDAGIIRLTLDGGAGADTILGSRGADVILGGDDDDFINGNEGSDIVLMGAGDDVFQWEAGDGSDTLEGQAGNDRLFFFGSNADENIDIADNGGRVRVFRDVGAASLDLNDVEQLELRAFGGADDVVIGDLSGTEVTQVGLDLRGAAGGGDGQTDSVTVNATQGNDLFGVAGDAGGISVFGLPTLVKIFHQEQANDRLILNALGGADVVDATSLEADGIQLTINGGLGDDMLIGSEGGDLFNGGDGNDFVLMGDGDDTFVWNPGDDNDTLEGQAGADTMIFNGSNANENINISANGGRVTFLRDIASVVLDLDDVEKIEINALGGADNVIIHDLTGTDVTEVNVNLGAVNGAGDAQPDTVIVNGTSDDDVALVFGDASGTSVLGLFAQVNISRAEASNDRLVVQTLAGDDVIEASALAAGAIQLVGNGGDDDDILIGGDGNDVLLGGAGDDVLLGGLGLDVLDGGPGDNVVIQ